VRLPELLEVLMDRFIGSLMELDAKGFKQYVARKVGYALERTGFVFSYLDDVAASLDAMPERLAQASIARGGDEREARH
jgi:hypothetical protein